jgi:hypothetical protein
MGDGHNSGGTVPCSWTYLKLLAGMNNTPIQTVGTAALQGFWNVILTESLMFLPAGKGI